MGIKLSLSPWKSPPLPARLVPCRYHAAKKRGNNVAGHQPEQPRYLANIWKNQTLIVPPTFRIAVHEGFFFRPWPA